MNTFRFSPMVMALALVFIATIISAQSTKKSVILYNSEPYLAEYTTNGEIVNLIEKKPNYLRGYDVKPTNTGTDGGQAFADVTPVSNSSVAVDAVSADRKFLNFDSDYATLDELSTQRLDRVEKYLNENAQAKVMVTSHKVDESTNSVKLSNNRLDSCKKYLELKGIATDRIILSSVYAPSLKDKVSITYVR